jgi:hypothetical protein
MRGIWVAEILGLRPFDLRDQSRGLYHAGAVIASNYVVAMADTAQSLGAWSERVADPEDVAAAIAQPQPVTSPISSRNRELQGVGGWLLFFCIALIILGPLVTLVQVMNLPNVDALGMILEFARAALGIVVGILLWNVRPIAFTLLWIYFGFVALMAVLGIIGFAVLEQKRPEDLIVSVRALIYVTIWFLYFRKSERVRATFGRNL